MIEKRPRDDARRAIAPETMRLFLQRDAFGEPILFGDSVRREVFTSPDGRLLGTETVRHHRWEGRDAPVRWTEEVTDTRVFFLKAEAGAWRSELDCRVQVLLAACSDEGVIP